MINSEHQLVSIGMPIYNEERFLRVALDAIVAQDYPNIELIISDNCSTDGSANICQEYARKYEWITYHRYESNTGPARNFSHVLNASRGKYFMWAAGHDRWDANYIHACVKMLEKHPQAAIAYGSSVWIDERGGLYGRESGYSDTRGMNEVARYFTVLWGNMHPILGVIRKEYIMHSPLLNMVGSDLVMLSRLSLIGDFLHVSDSCWYRREFRAESSYGDKLKRYKSDSYGLANTRVSKLFPLLQLPFELVRVVWGANLAVVTKVMILLLLLPSFPARYFAAKR
ncbi:MAG: glycosyltransferase family 2 protein [Gammaproteobacteria bacterium]|nr:glycosyltransferase family 2 protein [Gammaproteobacteria bacterium]